MKTKRLFMKAISLLAVFVLCVACFTQTQDYNVEVNASTLSDLQAKLKSNQAKQTELKNKISAAKDNIAKQQEYQAALDEQIKVTEDNIYIIEQQIALLDQEIVAKEASIAQQEVDIAQGIEDFKTRLRAMYISGNDNIASVLVGSSDFYDLLARMELVKKVSIRDDELIDTLNAQLSQLNTDKAALEQTKAEADAQKVSLEQNKSDLGAAYDASTNEQARIKAQMEEYAANQAELEADEKKTETLIQAEIARLATIQNYVGGDFAWPVPGYTTVTSVYGTRTLFGVTKFHKGVDISGSGVYGKPIIAANSGKVIAAVTNYTPNVSYGMYVMIDHGGGKVTLYAHCSKLAVSAGQTVSQGQTIAYIGSTGNSTGPHLHFEIRINGNTTNPLQYFPSSVYTINE